VGKEPREFSFREDRHISLTETVITIFYTSKRPVNVMLDKPGPFISLLFLIIGFKDVTHHRHLSKKSFI